MTSKLPRHGKNMNKSMELTTNFFQLTGLSKKYLKCIEGEFMTDVVKRNGKKEPFNAQKLRKSIENAVSDSGSSVTQQMKAIEHATQDAENIARERNEISTQEIRNEIVNDLESDAPQVAQAWRNYEKQHGINY